jgi:HlyD family secretion protein
MLAPPRSGERSHDLERKTTAMARETSLEPQSTIQPLATNATGLPAVIAAPPASPSPRRSVWRRVALVAIVVAAGTTGAVYWATHNGPALPPFIAWSNGRLEADEIDIDTKFAGRIAAVLADEGDVVHAGQVVARMDTRDLEASLRQAEAQIEQADHSIAAARAELDQAASQVTLMAQELQRARSLLPKGFQTQEVVDQRQSQFNVARATVIAAQARIEAAVATRDAAMHSAELIRVNIADGTLVAPKDGPIQYRLANTGEVLGAGGRVFAMLDMSYVYMDIFLPTADCRPGRIVLGADARIVRDAQPDAPVPAKVVFVASQNQFTPKMVETRSERDRLMFGVRVRIDPDLARTQAAQIRSGLPGLAYVLLDPHGAWPPALQPRSPG